MSRAVRSETGHTGGGALAGSFALGIIQQFSSAVLGYNWRDVVTFLILVLVLLFKPTGLFGEALQRARV